MTTTQQQLPTWFDAETNELVHETKTISPQPPKNPKFNITYITEERHSIYCDLCHGDMGINEHMIPVHCRNCGEGQ